MAVSSSVDRFNGVIASKAIKVRCAVAVTTDIPFSQGAPQLTNPIEGVFVVPGDRVLLTAQSPASQNGIWVVPSSGGVSTRAADWDGNRDVELGTVVFAGVSGGGDDQLWQITAPAGEIVVGSTNVTIEQLVFGAGSFNLQDVTTNGETTDVGIDITDGATLILRDPTDNTAFVTMSVEANGDWFNMDFTNIGDLGSNGGLRLRATGNQPNRIEILDFANTFINAQRPTNTFVGIGEPTVLRGDGQQAFVTWYGEDSGVINSGQISHRGDRMWWDARPVNAQIDSTGAIELNTTALKLSEVAAPDADELTYGQIWVRDSDNGLVYRNELGTDFVLTDPGLPSGNTGEMVFISAAPNTYLATPAFQVISSLPELHENTDTTNTKRLGVYALGVEIFGSEGFSGDPAAGGDQDTAFDWYNNNGDLIASQWYDEGTDWLYENYVEGGRIDFLTTQSPGGGGVYMLSLDPTASGRGIRFDTHSLGGRVNIPDNDPVINLATSVNVAKYQIVDTINAGNPFAHFGYDGSSLELEIKNLIASSTVTIKGTNSGASEVNFMIANPNTDTLIQGETGLRLRCNSGVLQLQTGGVSRVEIDNTNQRVAINDFSLFIEERASALADVAGYGQLWVLNAAPNELWFTDDTGVDHQLTPPGVGIGAGVITNTMLADMAGQTVKVRTAGTGVPQDLSLPTNRILGNVAGAVSALDGSQVNTILPNFTSALDGLAPASGGGSVNFLRADGSWSTPAGTGAGITGTPVDNQIAVWDSANSIEGVASLTFDGTKLRTGGVFALNQRASAPADVADDGQIWLEDENPQRLAFTNDDGEDVYLHPVTVRKTADENVNNSTAFQDDDHLVISNLPAGQYRLDMLLRPRDVAVTGCGMRLTFSATSVDSQSMMHVLGDTFTGAAAPAYDEVGRITDTFDAIPLDTGSGTSRVMVTGYFRSFGGGSIQFRWAQNTAQVGDLRLEAQSFLSVTQLGQV